MDRWVGCTIMTKERISKLSPVFYHGRCVLIFCHPKSATERTVGGNYGLNDQLQALTFIHQNKEKMNYNRLTIRKVSNHFFFHDLIQTGWYFKIAVNQLVHLLQWWFFIIHLPETKSIQLSHTVVERLHHWMNGLMENQLLQWLIQRFSFFNNQFEQL